MNSRPQAWFKQAKDDLGVAKLTRDNGYNYQACYFASQAAEKALKGLIWSWVRSQHIHTY